MGNYHGPLQDGVTRWRAADMNPPLAGLDEAVGVIKNLVVHCDGHVSYVRETGVLAWDGTLRVLWNNASGKTIENVVDAGLVVLGTNEIAYLDLVDSNGSTVTVEQAEIQPGEDSAAVDTHRVVLAYRATSGALFPVHLLSANISELGRERVRFFQAGKPGSGALIFLLPMTLDVRFDAVQQYSRCSAGVAADAEADISVKKNGKTFGVIRFDAAADTAAFLAAENLIDNAAASDKGSGLVGIPITGHDFEEGDEVEVSGTSNYDGEYTVESETADEIVVTAAYEAETFGGTETVTKTSTTTLHTGDVLTVVAQDGADAALADIGGELVGEIVGYSYPAGAES